jgi:hypothetical protein
VSNDPRVRLIAVHIRSIAAQAEPGGERLASAIIRRCRSAGEDRTAAAARDWVRRWGPHRLASLQLPCTCAVGRCRVCN